MIELSASGYRAIGVDRAGRLVDDLLASDPPCGVGFGINKDVPPFSMAFKLLKMEGIEISGAKVELTREIEPGIIIDYDTNGHINRYRGAFSGQEGNS